MREHRVRVVVTCAAALLVAMPLFAGFAGTDVLVPLAGYGGSSLPAARPASVSLHLANPSTSANALITVELYEFGSTNNPTAMTKLVLGPDQTSTIADPLVSLFGLPSADGALRLVSTTEVLVAIHAEANDSASAGASGAGAGFEGVPASFAIASGQATNLLGVAVTDAQDYRFSTIETAGQPAVFTVSVKSDSGQVVASRSYDLPSHGAMERSVEDISPRPFVLASGRLTLEVTGGDGAVLAYGMQVDRLSANAAGFSMAFDDSLLVSPFTAVTSLNALKGDVTLQGSDTLTVATTPNGDGQPGGTISLDTPAYTAGTGLGLASHQFSLLGPYRLPQACAAGQRAGWDGSSWVCSNVSISPGSAIGNTPYWDGAQWVPTSRTLFNDGARIGVGGVSNPRAQLEVGGTDGLVVTGTVNAGTVRALGPGVRMQWYPRKGAFRVGMAESTWWDDDGSTYPHLALYSIGMGYQPRASGVASTAIGAYNKSTGDYALTLGSYNTASASHAIAIGTQVYATGIYSIALGAGAHTNGHDGAVVIGDDTYFQTAYASADNQLTMRFSGPYGGNWEQDPCGTGNAAYRLWTSYPDCTAGVFMRHGQSGWSNYSSRARKENFRELDGEELLAGIRDMSITEWNYKGTDPNVKYIGPVAEEFAEAFHLNGDDPAGINSVSIDGVNMAGVQALERRTSFQREQIAAQEAKIAALVEERMAQQARLADLERRLAAFEAQGAKAK